MKTNITGQLRATAAMFLIASGIMFANISSADQSQLKSTDGTDNLASEFVDF